MKTKRKHAHQKLKLQQVKKHTHKIPQFNAIAAFPVTVLHRWTFTKSTCHYEVKTTMECSLTDISYRH